MTTKDSNSTQPGRPDRRQPTARRARGPQPGTHPSETEGGQLERRVSRVEFAEGALVRLRVPVPAESGDSGKDVLTDIDVLSVEVGTRLQVVVSSSECKSGKGQSGEAYTIVWLAGFRQLMGLARVSVVRQTLSAKGRALARRLGIVAIDEVALARREAAHAWVPQRFAHVDGQACTDAETRTDTQLKGLNEVSGDLVSFLRGGSLLADSPAILASLSELGSSTAKHGVLPNPTAQILGGHALIAIVTAGLRDASRLDELGEQELRARLYRALTLGDENDIYMLPLLERADALVGYIQNQTHKAYAAAGAEPHRIEVPSLRDAIAAPPGYLNDYLDFVNRLRANPQIARELLQTAELVCFEALLNSEAWKAPAFDHLFTAEHRSLLLVALRSLQSVSGENVVQPLKAIGHLDFRGIADRVGVNDRQQAVRTEGANKPNVQDELPLDD